MPREDATDYIDIPYVSADDWTAAANTYYNYGNRLREALEVMGATQLVGTYTQAVLPYLSDSFPVIYNVEEPKKKKYIHIEEKINLEKGEIMKAINPVDTKNKLLISKLVKNHFSLTDKSFKLFKQRLFNEPHINPIYEKILKDSKDLRVRYKLNPDDFEFLDEGWKFFREFFSSKGLEDFTKDITYENFRSNLIEVDGQKVKLKKTIVKYFSQDLIKFIRSFGTSDDLANEIGKQLEDNNKIDSKRFSYCFRNVSRSGEIQITRGYNDNISFQASSIKVTEEMTKIIEEEVRCFLERVGERKLPSKENIELVFSLNFADWFLCSTDNGRWSSCLNVESDHQEPYWAGLPGLVGDKNRAMVYLTDGTTKNHLGIKVDRVLARSWVLTVMNEKKTELFFVKEYPGNFNLKDLTSKILGTKLLDRNNLSKFRGRYYNENLFHKTNVDNVNFLSYIFQDSTCVKFAKKNRTKYFPFDYSILKPSDKGFDRLMIKEEDGTRKLHKFTGCFAYSNGLNGLVRKRVMRQFTESELRHYFRLTSNGTYYDENENNENDEYDDFDEGPDA
jgi:hypothetical protein